LNGDRPKSRKNKKKTREGEKEELKGKTKTKRSTWGVGRGKRGGGTKQLLGAIKASELGLGSPI